MNLARITLVLLFCAVSVTASAGKKDRGVVSVKSDSVHFAPKGSIIAGGAATWASFRGNNYEISIIKDVNLSGYSLNLSPQVMYLVMNDLAVGVSGIYKRIKADIPSSSIKLDDVSIDLDDYYLIEHKYGFGVFLRKYLPLGKSGRFALYADLALDYLGGQSKMTDRRGNEVVGSYQTSNSFGIGLYPGAAAHITDRFALGLGLELLGIDFKWIDQTHNQVDSGTRKTFSASYNINLLSLSLSAYYCF